MQKRDCGYTPARSIFCLSHIWVEADFPLCKIVLHAPGPGCSMAFLWSFPSGRGFSICARKALRQSCYGGSERINITGLNEWCRQTKKIGSVSNYHKDIMKVLARVSVFGLLLIKTNTFHLTKYMLHKLMCTILMLSFKMIFFYSEIN